jgi:molybdate transport system ATP-binding protein
VLLLDEPMSALDVTAAPALRRLLRDILRGQKRTAVIVTHDLLDALAIADKVVVFERGRVVETGPVRSVLMSPRSDFAARIAGVNLVQGVITEPGILRTAWGTELSGTGDISSEAAAVALFRPTAVAVHLDAPHGSPRNVIPVSIAEMDIHGTTVRVGAPISPTAARARRRRHRRRRRGPRPGARPGRLLRGEITRGRTTSSTATGRLRPA